MKPSMTDFLEKLYFSRYNSDMSRFDTLEMKERTIGKVESVQDFGFDQDGRLFQILVIKTEKAGKNLPKWKVVLEMIPFQIL
jgi:hypothetical protein